MSFEKVQRKMEYLKLNHTVSQIPELFEDAAKRKSSHLEFFDHLLGLEIQAREESRIEASLKVSGLPKGMHLENFDFLFQPSIDKVYIENLSTCDYIRQHENVLFFGPPGVGKIHVAVGLGVKAIHMGYSVIYYTLEELLLQLKKRSDIPVAKQRARAYVKNDLVILDEFGYQVLDRHDTHLFFQFISAMYRKGSTIITSNRSIKEWDNIFTSDQMATTAILYRLFHKVHIFNVCGKSCRLRNYNKLMKEAVKNER